MHENCYWILPCLPSKTLFFLFFLNSFLSPHHHHSVKRQLCSVAAVVAITSNWIVYSSLSLHFYSAAITKFFWLNLLIALSCYFDKLLLTLALSIPCMTTMQLPSINFCCTLNSQKDLNDDVEPSSSGTLSSNTDDKIV